MTVLTGYSVPETLTDDAGNAMKGVTVTVTGPSSYSGTATSDATSGVLRLGPLPVGDYTIVYGSRAATVPVFAAAADIVTAAGGGGAVASVNAKTGTVVLVASDVGADASGAATAAQAAAISTAAADATTKANAAQAAAISTAAGDATTKANAAQTAAVAAAASAASGTFVTVVEHGATAGTARPTGALRVFWRGTVTPTNIAVGDRFVNISTPTAPVESICVSIGPVVLAALGGGSAASATVTTVAYAATVTPAVNAGGDVLNIGALTGNLTLANPTGSPTDGQTLKVRLSQDATGGRTITFGTAYAFGTDIPSTAVPVGVSAAWEMLFSWHTSSSKWRAVGLVRGF